MSSNNSSSRTSLCYLLHTMQLRISDHTVFQRAAVWPKPDGCSVRRGIQGCSSGTAAHMRTSHSDLHLCGTEITGVDSIHLGSMRRRGEWQSMPARIAQVQGCWRPQHRACHSHTSPGKPHTSPSSQRCTRSSLLSNGNGQCCLAAACIPWKGCRYHLQCMPVEPC